MYFFTLLTPSNDCYFSRILTITIFIVNNNIMIQLVNLFLSLQENTFQLILATDWTYSFAIFTYPENGLNWGIDPYEGSYSVAGYNVGDGVGYLNLPGSGTENVTLLDEIEGNTGKIGQWVYRIDSNQSLSSEGECQSTW